MPEEGSRGHVIRLMLDAKPIPSTGIVPLLTLTKGDVTLKVALLYIDRTKVWSTADSLFLENASVLISERIVPESEYALWVKKHGRKPTHEDWAIHKGLDAQQAEGVGGRRRAVVALREA